MKTNFGLNNKGGLHIFDVLPDFAKNAAITTHQGVYLSCYLTTVTPKMASEILLTQANNRNISLTREREYRNRMRRGEWVLAEPWLFDEDGHLIDGQHRATALAGLSDHDISIPVLLVQGWPDETQSAVDIGYNRKTCSIAQLQGIDIKNSHLAILNAMFVLRNTRQSLTAPPQSILAYKKMKPGIDFAALLRDGSGQKFAPVRSVVAIAYPYENHEKLDRFLTVWDTMIAADEVEQSIARLRSQYETSDGAHRGLSFRVAMARRAVTVLQAFLSNRPLKNIRETKICPWELPNIVEGQVVVPSAWAKYTDNQAA